MHKKNGKKLTAKQKIAAVVTTLALVVGAILAVYFFMTDFSPELSNNQENGGQEDGPSQGIENDAPPLAPTPAEPQAPRPPQSRRSGNKKVEEEFTELITKLENDPTAQGAASLLADVKAIFCEAKAKSANSMDNYHPALKYQDLSEYIEAVVKVENANPEKKKKLEQVQRLLSEIPTNKKSTEEIITSTKNESGIVPEDDKIMESLEDEILEVPDVLKLSKEKIESLLEDAPKKAGRHDLRQNTFNALGNEWLFELVKHTVNAYPNDATMRAWAESDYSIRHSPAFIQILKNRARYADLDEIMSLLEIYTKWVLHSGKHKMYPGSMFKGNSDWTNLDLAFVKTKCDHILSQFARFSILFLKDKPEAEQSVVNFCNAEDEQALKEAVQSLLNSDYKKDLLLRVLKDMGKINPYHAGYEWLKSQ